MCWPLCLDKENWHIRIRLSSLLDCKRSTIYIAVVEQKPPAFQVQFLTFKSHIPFGTHISPRSKAKQRWLTYCRNMNSYEVFSLFEFPSQVAFWSVYMICCYSLLQLINYQLLINDKLGKNQCCYWGTGVRSIHSNLCISKDAGINTLNWYLKDDWNKDQVLGHPWS